VTRYELVHLVPSQTSAEWYLKFGATGVTVDVCDPEAAKTNVELHLRVHKTTDDWFVVETVGGVELLRRRRARWALRAAEKICRGERVR